MRIISDFHDYYDVVQAQGQDQSLLYLRKQKEKELTIRPELIASNNGRYDQYFSRLLSLVESAAIGFCGKVYPVVKINIATGNGNVDSHGCYKIEDVDSLLEANLKDKDLDVYYGNKSLRELGLRWPSGTSFSRKLFKGYFEKDQNALLAKFFTEERCPVFVMQYHGYSKEKNKLVVNGCLKDWQFFKIFDTYTAFQELSMYIGGMAAPEKEIPDVSDSDMLVAKGYDKWSFRKPPKSK